MAPKRNPPPPSSVPPSVSTPSHGQTSASSTPIKTSTTASSRSAANTPQKPTARQTSSSSSSTNNSSTSIRSANDAQQIVQGVWNRYLKETPQRVKLIDVFMLFLVVVGALQFLYCVIAGNFPFNAFLSGFGATVGQFVLTASLRIQTNPQNKSEFEHLSHERAFGDFIFASVILHLFVVNFIN